MAKPAKKTDPIEEIMAEVEGDLEKAAQGTILDAPEDPVEETPEESTPAPKAPKKSKGKATPKRVPEPAPEDEDLIVEDVRGKRVKFVGDDGFEVSGTVLKQIGPHLEVESDNAIWDEVELKNVELVEEGADATPSPKARRPKKVSVELVETDSAVGSPFVYERIDLVPIDEVVIPEDLVREHDPEDPKWKALVEDIEDMSPERPLLDAVVLSSPEDKTLVDGLGRYWALRKLNRTHVPCRYAPVGSVEERLWEGVRRNVLNRPMHWLDLAKNVARIVHARVDKKTQKPSDKGVKVLTQRKVARVLGMTESDVTRMVAAAGLPSELCVLAKKNLVEKSVFLEIPALPEEARQKVREVLEAGGNLTVVDVRAIRDEHREVTADEPKLNQDGSARSSNYGGARATERPRASATYRDLSASDTGPLYSARVHKDRVELTLQVPKGDASFKGWDILLAVRNLFRAAFDDDSAAVRSFESLNRALSAERSRLVPDEAPEVETPAEETVEAEAVD